MNSEIPKFDHFFLPVLDHCSDGSKYRPKDVVPVLIRKGNFTDAQQSILIGSGRNTKLKDRIQWALYHLFKAGLLGRPIRGVYSISEEGLRVLNLGLDEISISYLLDNYESYHLFARGKCRADESDDITQHWIMGCSSNEELWQQFQDDGIAAIGWDYLGDLSSYDSREEIRQMMVEETGQEKSFMNDTLCNWQFSRDVSVGDKVYIKKGIQRIIGYGVVTEEYSYEKERTSYQHIIKVKWESNKEYKLPADKKLVTKTLTRIDNYRWMIDSFKSFYEDGVEPEITDNQYTRKEALEELLMSEQQFDTIISLIERKKNIILQGPPGVGKTFVARRLAYSIMGEQNTELAPMIQFHQSYAYEDFIQGYRPDGQGGFNLKNGTFYDLCKNAEEDLDRPYFLIIDEINRGNLSKIFGELMMLIEHDKREEGYSLGLTYSSENFYVPPNLHIIGTMNTADRSLSMVDYALRRRFSFMDLKPEFNSNKFAELLSNAGVKLPLVKDIQCKLESLNEVICEDKENLGKGYQIGHSFFCPAKGVVPDRSWFQQIVEYEIEPLLKEYWMDDEDKAQREIDRLFD